MATLAQHARDPALLVGAGPGFDPDEVPLRAMIGSSGQRGGLELLAVPLADHVARRRRMCECGQLTDDEHDHRTGSGQRSLSMHVASLPRMR